MCVHHFWPALSLPAENLQTKINGKVERPFRYIREDLFLARSLRLSDGGDLGGAYR